MRGAWIATVFGINWPSSTSASAATKQQELRAIIDAAADAGLNALFFQVRPESDALYVSSYEPWSRFLTGTQGQDPGFDPLAVAIEHAHRRGIELHAWINPYRGLTSSSVNAASTHVTRTLSQHALTYGNMKWMDPSAHAVRAHVVNVVTDIIERYDIDGIHFDDYFYPYPDGTNAFPDDAQFAAYQSGGGSMSKGDWRRENVNSLIEEVSIAIAQTRASVRFGVSPFGIYRPGTPQGITGLDAYEAISCDPVTWLAMDWVDYLAPQLYWPTTQTRQAFGTLLPWWSSLPDGDGRFILAGMNLANIGTAAAWTLDEYRTQIDITRAHLLDDGDGAGGTILYHLKPIVNDANVRQAFAAKNARLALPPPVVADRATPAVPTVDGRAVTVKNTDRGIAVYERVGSDTTLVALHFANEIVLDESDVERIVTAIGKNDRESPGVVIAP